MRKIVVSLACFAFAVCCLLSSTIGNAHAQSSATICANSGSGLCFDTQVLNPVAGDILKNKTFSGSSEQAFVLQLDPECDSSDTVTFTCPFSNTTLDSNQINNTV